MTVSVVIATFQAAATLERALQSVCAQTAQPEIILIDGGSRDATMDIAARHRDRLAVCISERDRGVYDALSKGVARATGDYVYILGSDDALAHPRALEALLAGADGADVAYGRVTVVDAAGLATEARPLPLARFKYQMPFSHQGVIVRRALFGSPAFGSSLASDYRQLFALYLGGHRFREVDAEVARYALGGLSDRQAAKSTWDRLRINVELRGWRALDVLPFYLAQTAVCLVKPRLVRLLRGLRRGASPAAGR